MRRTAFFCPHQTLRPKPSCVCSIFCPPSRARALPLTSSQFLAVKKNEMFCAHLEQLLNRMVPADACKHLLLVASGQAATREWGELHESVSILFLALDLETAQTDKDEEDYASVSMVQELNRVFSALDLVLEAHSACYKVETVCNTYVVSAGVPTPCADHAHRLVALASSFAHCLHAMRWLSGNKIGWKMGMSAGPIFAGIAGRTCPRFRLFGDTINTASRMYSISRENSITFSRGMMQLLSPSLNTSHPRLPQAVFDDSEVVEIGVDLSHVGGGEDLVAGRRRGLVDVKGKGEMEIWELVSPLACDADGNSPFVKQVSGGLSDYSGAVSMPAIKKNSTSAISLSVTNRSTFSGKWSDQDAELFANLRGLAAMGGEGAPVDAGSRSRSIQVMKLTHEIELAIEDKNAANGLSHMNTDIHWLTQQFTNTALERMYFRRSCAAVLKTQLVTLGVLAVVLVALVAADAAILSSVPELKPAFFGALYSCVVLVVAALALGACYALSLLSPATSSFGKCLYSHAQSALVLVGAIASLGVLNLLSWLTLMQGWPADAQRWPVSPQALAAALYDQWIPESNGLAVAVVKPLYGNGALMVLYLACNVGLRLPFGYSCLFFALDLALDISRRFVYDFWAAIPAGSYVSCAYGGEPPIAEGMLLRIICLYNVWLQERLERRQLADLVEATRVRAQVAKDKLFTTSFVLCLLYTELSYFVALAVSARRWKRSRPRSCRRT